MSGTMAPAPGFSLPIQVVEAEGFTAWLAEDHSIPVVSLAWGWDGGASLDPAGQEGAASLLAGLLTAGAGELDARAWGGAARDVAIGIGVDAGVPWCRPCRAPWSWRGWP